MYWSLDNTTDIVSFAVHCDGCEGFMGVGFPAKSLGNVGGEYATMVTSNAVIMDCTDSAATAVEYRLGGYVTVEALPQRALAALAVVFSAWLCDRLLSCRASALQVREERRDPVADARYHRRVVCQGPEQQDDLLFPPPRDTSV